MTDPLSDFDLARFEDLTADLDALRAAKLRASVLLEALKPFAAIAQAIDTIRDELGLVALADEYWGWDDDLSEGDGAVYPSLGDLRAARSAIASAEKP